MTSGRSVAAGIVCAFLLLVGVADAATGDFLTEWGSFGSGDGQFISPFGVPADNVRDVYVADRGNHRIQKFSSDGAFLRSWGWGVDTGAANFEVCTAATTPCQSGSTGSGDGQFALFPGPGGVATGNRGDVYVADRGNDRIQKFSSDGTFLATWGSEGSGEGQFNLPATVATDNVGDVYVAEALNHRIQKFAGR